MSIQLLPFIKKIALKKLILALIGLIMGLGILVFISYHLAYWKKIYPFINIARVKVGNKTQTQALADLEKIISQKKPLTIKLLIKNKEYLWSTEELQLQYFPKKTIAQVYQVGRRGDVWLDLQEKWQTWTQAKDLDLDYQLNWLLLEMKVASMAAELDITHQPPKISLQNNRLQVFSGQDGQTVNQSLVLKKIEEQLGKLESPTFSIPVTPFKVTLSEEETAVFQQRGENLLKKELKWQTEESQGVFQDYELIPLLASTDGYETKKIKELVDLLAERVEKEPLDALFEFTGNKVRAFQASQKGVSLKEEATQELIVKTLESLETNQDTPIITLPVVYSEPAVKTENINNLGIKERVGRGTSTFWGSIPSRIHNVKITAEKLNGVLIKPGAVLSFNQIIGDISAATGYKTAYIIKDGRTILGDGGGVCQVSTTLFRTALKSGLPIIERRAHSYRVGYYEQGSQPGFDATVYDPTADLKFKNDLSSHILIQTQVNLKKHQLTIDFYGTKDERMVEISQARVWDTQPPPEDLYVDDPSLPAGVIKQIDWKTWGAKVAFDWKVTRGADVLQEKTFYSRYRPWQSVFLRGIGPTP